MKRNAAALLSEASGILGGIGVRSLAGKADVITSGNFQPGDLMQQRAAHRLVDLTVQESGILQFVTNVKKDQRAGTIPLVEFGRPVARKATEGQPGTATSTPDTDGIEYRCRKLQATLFMSLESIREARATGEPDFENKIRRGFARALGNDVARLAFQGDTTLAPVDDEARLLCTIDGWLKQARNGRAIRSTTDRGAAFDPSVFFAIKRRMPRRFRNSTDNRWMIESLVDLAWRENRANAGDTSGIVTGDRALTQPGAIPMLGEETLRIPQLPTDLGFATLRQSTAAADNVATAGSGIAFRVNTLLGGAAAGNAGRVVRITCTATGESEEAVVTWAGGHNVATTEGTLGQGVVSTTAGDYTIDLTDCTPILYGPPKNLFLVWCDQIRSYQKVEQEAERIRIDVFLELDAGIFQPDALVMQDGLALPQASTVWG